MDFPTFTLSPTLKQCPYCGAKDSIDRRFCPGKKPTVLYICSNCRRMYEKPIITEQKEAAV